MNKCWCGSDLDYSVCHQEFDKKINYYKKRGVMTPPRSMIKNQKQIEGIKTAAVVNNGLLDHIEQSRYVNRRYRRYDKKILKRTQCSFCRFKL